MSEKDQGFSVQEMGMMGKIEDVVPGSIFVVTTFDVRKQAVRETDMYKEVMAPIKPGFKVGSVEHFTRIGAYHYTKPSTRVMGFGHSFEEAERDVLTNSMDICEGGSNKYAVIEASHPGMYPHAIELQWYEWTGDHETGQYVRCARPTGEDFDGMACWGLG